MNFITEHILTNIIPQDEDLLCYWMALLLPVVDIEGKMRWYVDLDSSSDAVLAFKIKGCPDFETLLRQPCC